MKKALIVGAATAAGLVAGRTTMRASRSSPAPSTERRDPVDVGFMLAIHTALRRDLVRLERATHTGRSLSPGAVAGWRLFRRELENHHRAEDEDLWPVVCRQLTTDAERRTIDTMYREHAEIPGALAMVDAAIENGAVPRVDGLAELVLDHLRHEESDALPLVMRYLSPAEWQQFLMTERRKRPPRQRVEFLTWVLDDADPVVAGPVQREIPPAGQFVYRNILRRVYDRRHLWADDGAPATSGPLARAS
jgi:hypothetical protein